jgi:hypothetical protein
MPKLNGKDIISESTEKVIRRAIIIAAAAIFTKLYEVPLGDLKVLGMELPPALFDTALLVLVVYASYSLVLNWLGDLLAFRLWFRENSIFSMIGTNMPMDKTFIEGAIPLLHKLHALENAGSWPTDYSQLDDKMRTEFADFKLNVELYCARLEAAGTRFHLLSVFGHYYVWVQSFLFPMALGAGALYLLFTYGTFTPPAKL